MSRFTRLSHPALLVLTGLVCLAAPRRVPAAGYAYSLFDGKTLNGWTIENKCKADVDKGKIRLHEGNGWLRSDHQYGDFLLQVEWKAEKETGYDGGIFVRTRPGGDPFPRQGYQLNLADGKEGACGRLPGATPLPGLIKRGDWNAFDILVVGNSVSLVINGRPAYRATGLKIDRGHIGIQVEVPGGGRLWFRNLRITELGHHSLFNGRDLSGWEGAGAKADTCWRVRAKKPPVQHSKLWARALKRFRSLGGDLAEISGPDNQYGDESVIECTGKKGPWLRTNRQYGDFNLRFEYQVSPGGNSGIYVRVPESGLHHRDNAQSPAGRVRDPDTRRQGQEVCQVEGLPVLRLGLRYRRGDTTRRPLGRRMEHDGDQLRRAAHHHHSQRPDDHRHHVQEPSTPGTSQGTGLSRSAEPQHGGQVPSAEDWTRWLLRIASQQFHDFAGSRRPPQSQSSQQAAGPPPVVDFATGDLDPKRPPACLP